MTQFEKESLSILQNLALSYKFEVTQENGQRTFGPPMNWEGRKPGVECEVFISKCYKLLLFFIIWFSTYFIFSISN